MPLAVANNLVLAPVLFLALRRTVVYISTQSTTLQRSPSALGCFATLCTGLYRRFLRNGPDFFLLLSGEALEFVGLPSCPLALRTAISLNTTAGAAKEFRHTRLARLNTTMTTALLLLHTQLLTAHFGVVYI